MFLITSMKLFHPYYLLLILLSFTTTSKAGVQYAKAGCNDTCGSVRIPFPFGIGANCAVNHWYIVDCNSSTPYLHALHHLQVLYVGLENQTVIVNTPIISDCSSNSSQTMITDLGKSPFLFSQDDNKFVFVGCGNGVMQIENGSAVARCSTDCHHDDSVSEENACLGITCCQKTIPYNLKSYTMNVTRLEGGQGRDGGCGSGFLVNKNSYDDGRSFFDSNSFIPISLLWTISDHDYFNQVSCCYEGRRYKLDLDVGNGTALNTWKCVLPYLVAHSFYVNVQGNPYLRNGCSYHRPVSKYAKTGCKSMCGSVRIPYPFGIGANCAVNDFYIIDCNSSIPYLSALHHLQVLGVDLETQTVTVNTPIMSDCSKSSLFMSIDLGWSPFFFSKSHNYFVFEGCGNAYMTEHGSALTGCSRDESVVHDKNKSLGCQTTIPRYLKSYTINLKRLERQGRDGGCGSAFLVDKNSYDQGRFSDRKSFIPISLLWTLSEHDSSQVTCDHYERDTFKVDLGNGTVVDTWKCLGYSCGNPYLVDGCVGHDMQDEVTEECQRCRDSGGYCTDKTINDVDGFVMERKFICKKNHRPSSGVILGCLKAYGSISDYSRISRLSRVKNEVFGGHIEGVACLLLIYVTRKSGTRFTCRLVPTPGAACLLPSVKL